ncbi:MAG: DUF502 domain-containing protein [Flavobacteriales bacterium]|jgi:uncharacterized membrane protein|nr:DUF502 domain-containing protein [Flavobacteriales bacterium]MCW8914123.1 DUF502 domain-containing protein [Flavobacteriales bacterium]MCW8938700.1 DUF502 domain-containing protein [Flavobacteriales bacterium]MCW8939935.1 DUF502 domain-containing protein [Flavobacteriales bacterium]MCW8969246.1 DUF502 domain-containing protein [Flavobacteriales bacterium]
MRPKSIFKLFLKYFFRGLLYAAPVTITIYIIIELFKFFDGLIPVGINVPGMGFLVLIVAITVLGVVGSSIILEPLKSQFNQILDKAPLLKTIYSSVKDLLSAFVGSKKSFDKPVLVKMNKDSNLEKLGFVTVEDLKKIGVTDDRIGVYLPHSYNFSGNFFIVPASQVTPVKDVKSADFMKFIVSGGVTKFD